MLGWSGCPFTFLLFHQDHHNRWRMQFRDIRNADHVYIFNLRLPYVCWYTFKRIHENRLWKEVLLLIIISCSFLLMVYLLEHHPKLRELLSISPSHEWCWWWWWWLLSKPGRLSSGLRGSWFAC